MLFYVYSIVEVVSFVKNCVSCYSERGTAEAGSSEQYLQYLRGFTSRWRQLDYNFMYNRKLTRAVVVSWSWYTDGRGPSLCCQPFLSDIWLAITDIVTALHVMQTRYSEENSVRLSVCPSVRLSVRRVICDKMEKRSFQIFIPYERTFSV